MGVEMGSIRPTRLFAIRGPGRRSLQELVVEARRVPVVGRVGRPVATCAAIAGRPVRVAWARASELVPLDRPLGTRCTSGGRRCRRGGMTSGLSGSRRDQDPWLRPASAQRSAGVRRRVAYSYLSNSRADRLDDTCDTPLAECLSYLYEQFVICVELPI